MPIDPSASGPRLHRHLRALQATVEATGHNAYGTTTGGLLVEARWDRPETSSAWVVVEGRPGSWVISGVEGILACCPEIDMVERHILFMLGL